MIDLHMKRPKSHSCCFEQGENPACGLKGIHRCCLCQREVFPKEWGNVKSPEPTLMDWEDLKKQWLEQFSKTPKRENENNELFLNYRYPESEWELDEDKVADWWIKQLASRDASLLAFIESQKAPGADNWNNALDLVATYIMGEARHGRI